MLSTIPVKINNVIRVGGYEIMPIEAGYYVIDIERDRVIEETWTRAAALAFVRARITNNLEDIPKIKELDSVIEKQELDSRFYKNSLTYSEDKDRHLAIRTRLELAEAITSHAKEQIREIILG